MKRAIKSCVDAFIALAHRPVALAWQILGDMGPGPSNAGGNGSALGCVVWPLGLHVAPDIWWLSRPAC